MAGEECASPISPAPVHVLYFKPTLLGSCLNVLRLLVGPHARSPLARSPLAHITVRGLYKADLREDGLEESLEKILISVSGVRIERLIRNRPPKQWVFYAFKCVSPDLERLWFDETPPHFWPHITMYRGSATKRALQFMKEVGRHSYDFSFTGRELLLWKESCPYRAVPCSFSDTMISDVLRERVDAKALHEMPFWKRGVLIRKICSFLSRQSFMG